MSTFMFENHSFQILSDDEDEYLKPPRENALKTGGLDMIVVPGLGFSPQGDRIGRGKGFYDNYIQRCEEENNKKPHLVALAFRAQICEEIPTSELDRRVDRIVYEGMTR